MRRFGIVLLSSLVLSACGEPTADTRSADAFETSLDRMRADLAPEDLDRFNDAVSTVLLSSFSDGDEESNGFAALARMAALADDPDQFLERAAPYLDGKTALQIMQEADRRTLVRLERQLAALMDTREANLAELAEIMAQQAEEAALDEAEAARIAAAREVVAQISIDRARYYWEERGYMNQALIGLRITNQTEHAVRTVYIHGLLETPGRSVPWVDGSFNYEFPGGLEPGEQQTLTLRPNQFGEWGNRDLQARDDLVLTLRATDFAGPDGQRWAGENSREIYAVRSVASRLAQSESRLRERIAADDERASE